MTRDVQDAVAILFKAYADVSRLNDKMPAGYHIAYRYLNNAIRHLAYPDRDVYPKVRHARKTVPFVKP